MLSFDDIKEEMAIIAEAFQVRGGRIPADGAALHGLMKKTARVARLHQEAVVHHGVLQQA